jgi:steroid delta-isomerase-like uncharacterized protein
MMKGGIAMSIKENKDLIHQAFEEWNVVNGDIAKMRSLYEKYYGADFIYHNMSGGDMSREKAMQENAASIASFPDIKYSIDDIIAEGEKTAIRFTMQATHKGPFMGIPATGKLVVVKGVEVDKIVDGKIVETWDFLDTLGMITQLGIIPGTATKI